MRPKGSPGGHGRARCSHEDPDLKVCMFSNMTNYEVKASQQARVVRGFQ